MSKKHQNIFNIIQLQKMHGDHKDMNFCCDINTLITACYQICIIDQQLSKSGATLQQIFVICFVHIRMTYLLACW